MPDLLTYGTFCNTNTGASSSGTFKLQMKYITDPNKGNKIIITYQKNYCLIIPLFVLSHNRCHCSILTPWATNGLLL